MSEGLSVTIQSTIDESYPLRACDIVQALDQYYKPRQYCLYFSELRIGTGYGKDADQRIDYWMIEGVPSKRFRRIAFEIKVSRSDFLAELRQPLKRRRALLLSNEFYFVAPLGLIRAEELPIEAGLIEVNRAPSGQYYVDWKYSAPWRDTSPPSWQFVAALVRRAQQESGASS